jgi:hypothetical protein
MSGSEQHPPPPETLIPNPGTLTQTLTSPEFLAGVGEEGKMGEMGVEKNL